MKMSQVFVLIFISALLGPLIENVASQGQQGGGDQGKMCLYDNQWYPPGSIVNIGRSDNWCYGAYCGKDKSVKYWDDYSCPMPTAGNPTPQIPAHVQKDIQEILNPNQQHSAQEKPAAQQNNLFGTQMFGSKPLFPPEQLNAFVTPVAPTTQSSFFDIQGCWYRDRFFWPGSDIFNVRKPGNRCEGAYCDWNSKVQTWTDTCTVTVPPPRRPPIDRT